VKTRANRLFHAALAACILGLVLCPFLFIAVGALSGFSDAFSFVMLPPFLLGSGFLLARFLSKPSDRAMRSVLLLAIEGVSWVAVGTFLYFVSGFNLMSGLERSGAACTSFLVASAASLPIVLLRRTALERRLAPLPSAVTVTLLLLILVVSGLATIAYLVAPPAFI